MSNHTTKRKRSGAEILCILLERQASRPSRHSGGANLPLYDALGQRGRIRHVLARHEQGAGFMAQGMARTSGPPGRVLRHLGPRGHQHPDRPGRRPAGLGAHHLRHRPGAHVHAGHGRLSGGGHLRHVPARDQAQLLVRSVEELMEVVPEAFRIAASGPSRPGAHRRAQGRADRARGHARGHGPVARARSGRSASGPGRGRGGLGGRAHELVPAAHALPGRRGHRRQRLGRGLRTGREAGRASRS